MTSFYAIPNRPDEEIGENDYDYDTSFDITCGALHGLWDEVLRKAGAIKRGEVYGIHQVPEERKNALADGFRIFCFCGSDSSHSFTREETVKMHESISTLKCRKYTKLYWLKRLLNFAVESNMRICFG